MKNLFIKEEIKGVSFKNKVVLAPMCTHGSDNSGLVNEFHNVHYGSFSLGQVGTIITEAVAVLPSGRISGSDLGIWNDNQIEGLKAIADFGKKNGSVMGIQLAHAGRKCGADEESVIYSSSNIEFSHDYKIPTALNIEEIEKIICAFGEAGKRAEKAGFQLVEIHAAHGYLINQFLSPLINNRTDKYGGNSIIKRSLLLKQIIEEVEQNFNGIISVRLSVEEYFKGGNNTDDYISLINELEGVDMFNISTGGVVDVVPPNVHPLYQIDFANRIKIATRKRIIGGGLITKISEIESIENEIDYIYIGRQLWREPNFVITCAKELGININTNKMINRIFGM